MQHPDDTDIHADVINVELNISSVGIEIQSNDVVLGHLRWSRMCYSSERGSV